MILHVFLPMSLIAMIPIGANGNVKLHREHSSSIVSNYKTSSGRGEVVSTAEGAEGWVEMDAKLDMRAIFAKLSSIPGILQILTSLSQKVDSLDQESLLAAILPAISGVKSSVGADINQIKVLLKELFQGLKNGPLEATDKQLARIIHVLESLMVKPVHCELGDLEKVIGKIGGKIEGQVSNIQQQIRTEIAKEDKELETANRNSELLGRILKLVERINGQVPAFGGNECVVCSVLHDLQGQERESINLIKSVVKAISGLPQSVISAIISESGFGGLRKEILKLLKSNESIRSSIGDVTHMVEHLLQVSEKYFKEHASMMMEVSLSAKNSASTVQSSSKQTIQMMEQYAKEAARAAKAASRSCGRK